MSQSGLLIYGISLKIEVEILRGLTREIRENNHVYSKLYIGFKAQR